jgi:hypothetical protein
LGSPLNLREVLLLDSHSMMDLFDADLPLRQEHAP